MKLHHITLAILFISMIVLGCTYYISGLQVNYSVTADMSALNKTQTHLEEQRISINKTYSSIEKFTTDSSSVTGALDIPYDMLKIGWSSGKTLLASLRTLQAIFSDTTMGLSKMGIPLPGWLLPTVISMIALTIIAMVIYGFFKWKFED